MIDSVADEKWGIRYSDRMNKHLDKLAGADTGVNCYDENFPAGEEEEGDEITVFDADNMCKLNGQVNAALNSEYFSRNSSLPINSKFITESNEKQLQTAKISHKNRIYQK